MRVRFTAAAEADLADAVDWYKAKTPRAAAAFLDELEAVADRIAHNPFQFPVVEGDARRAGFRRFPYGLFFVIGASAVEVFACFHASRDPRRWRTRI